MGGDADGGGIWFRVSSGYSGTLTLDHTRVVSNTAANGTKPNGGGVAVIVQPGGTGVVTISDSTIALNRAQYGGGMLMGVHDGTPAGSLTLTISRSTISNNLAVDPAGGSAIGGGIETYDATVTIANSTISGNSVADAYWSSGGGIWMGNSSGSQPSILNLVNTTVAGCNWNVPWVESQADFALGHRLMLTIADLRPSVEQPASYTYHIWQRGQFAEFVLGIESDYPGASARRLAGSRNGQPFFHRSYDRSRSGNRRNLRKRGAMGNHEPHRAQRSLRKWHPHPTTHCTTPAGVLNSTCAPADVSSSTDP